MVGYVDSNPEATKRVQTELGIEDKLLLHQPRRGCAGRASADLAICTLRTEAHYPVVKRCLELGFNVHRRKALCLDHRAGQGAGGARQGQWPGADGQPELSLPAGADRGGRTDRRAEVRAGEPGVDRLPPACAEPGLPLLGHARSAAGRHVDPPFRPDAHGAGRRAQARFVPHLEPGSPARSATIRSAWRRWNSRRARSSPIAAVDEQRSGDAVGGRVDDGLLGRARSSGARATTSWARRVRTS